MKLKCIGGEADGRYWHVEDVMRIGDFVRVIEEAKISLDISKVNQAPYPDYVTVKYLIYRIEELKFTVENTVNTYDRVRFLVTQEPVRMSFFEAVKYQFSK